MRYYILPTYAEGDGMGIGFSFEVFFIRFREICKEQLEAKKGHAFAFIFCNFENESVRTYLDFDGGFAIPNSLASPDLSIFYMNTGDFKLHTPFDKLFRYEFRVRDIIDQPSLLFMRLNEDMKEVVECKMFVIELLKDHPFEIVHAEIQKYLAYLAGGTRDARLDMDISDVLKRMNYFTKDEFVRLLKKYEYQSILGNFDR